MGDLSNWTEITKGLYRYVISAGACYEIVVRHHNHNDNILSAEADVYITGDWRNDETGENYFEREALNDLGNSIDVRTCLQIAKKDYEENCT